MGAVKGTGGGITCPVVVACGTGCVVFVSAASVGGAAGARTGVCGIGVGMRLACIVVTTCAISIRTHNDVVVATHAGLMHATGVI